MTVAKQRVSINAETMGKYKGSRFLKGNRSWKKRASSLDEKISFWRVINVSLTFITGGALCKVQSKDHVGEIFSFLGFVDR